MSLVIKTITSIIMTILVSLGVSNMAETTPQEAADDFFSGLTSGDDQVMAQYMDNEYINFLENVKGSDKEMDRLEEALLKNFSYKITDSATRGDIAVCKVELNNCDFSKVLENYEESSYKYVMDNLYEDDVTDKEKLNKKCIEIYLDEIEKAAATDPSYHQEIFLPMEDNGYKGWRIVLSDEIMQAILGGLQIPTEDGSNASAGEGGDE